MVTASILMLAILIIELAIGQQAAGDWFDKGVALRSQGRLQWHGTIKAMLLLKHMLPTPVPRSWDTQAKAQLLFFELVTNGITHIANMAANVAESTRSRKFLYTNVKEPSRDLVENGLCFNSHAGHAAH
jgi:hypothetical protein